jgi:hypothetical protein
MTMPRSVGATPHPAEIAGRIIESASKEGRRVIDAVDYLSSLNAVVIKCGPLSLSIDVGWIPEFSGISPEDLSGLTLSAGGATVKLEKHNIYIEVVSLVVDTIEQMSRRRTGGLIMELLEHRAPSA